MEGDGACVVCRFITTAQACEIERNVVVEVNGLILQDNWRGPVLVVKTKRMSLKLLR